MTIKDRIIKLLGGYTWPEYWQAISLVGSLVGWITRDSDGNINTL
jgi:hypothetical protein